jgi:putative endonuclease
MWYVYVLKCADGSLYTGISTDVRTRLLRHNSGKGSKYTRARRPVGLIYYEIADSKSKALQREIQIKSFSIENKKKLIRFGTGQRFSLGSDNLIN